MLNNRYACFLIFAKDIFKYQMNLTVNTSCAIRPFATLESCGDFAQVNYDEQGAHFIVGDISGHGFTLVREIADEVKQCFQENVQASLLEQYGEISCLPRVCKYGMTLCLGHFDKQLSTLTYLCVGNIDLHLIRGQEVTKLDRQDGVVGILVPQAVQVQHLALQQADRLLITSDGVRSAELNAILTSDLRTNSTRDVVQRLVQEGHNLNDDALCLGMDFIERQSMQNLILDDLSMPAES